MKWIVKVLNKKEYNLSILIKNKLIFRWKNDQNW